MSGCRESDSVYSALSFCRGTRTRTETKSSQRTRAAITLYPENERAGRTTSILPRLSIPYIISQ